MYIYQRGPHYAGIKIYNNNTTQIKLLSSGFNQFKKFLRISYSYIHFIL